MRSMRAYCIAWMGIAALAAGMAACGGSTGNPGSGGGGAGASGTGASSGTGGKGGTGGSMPVVPAGHPRVYLNEANKQRLSAALSAEEAAATRFRDMVDGQLAGSDYYAFAPHYAALLGAL